MASESKYLVPVMSELAASGRYPEYLYWVGCAGAFDDRYKKVARAFAKILNYLSLDYACLGTEETCNGDPARRAGNEMLFQMQAAQVMATFNQYQVKKILTTCPHCYNTFKNEYPELGGKYEVIHHSQFLRDQIASGKINIPEQAFSGTNITFHDPCYLGRANEEYEAPRSILETFRGEKTEMKKNRSYALCCGAGGAQMFKEAEKGHTEVFQERTKQVLETGANVLATACPFCMTMLTDGIKYANREDSIRNLDLAEMVAEALGL
jgi:heterodisulfide reductase subunit D